VTCPALTCHVALNGSIKLHIGTRGIMLTIHRLTAGDGYKYLLRHIASGDVDRRLATPLTAYYTASGYPPGRWLGRGLNGLGGGEVRPGSEVTEEQMTALFGRAEDPLTGRTLGRPYRVFKPPSERIQDQIRTLDPALSDRARQDAIEQIRKSEMRQKTKQAVAGFDLTFSPPSPFQRSGRPPMSAYRNRSSPPITRPSTLSST
jgi:hypothetical protein